MKKNTLHFYIATGMLLIGIVLIYRVPQGKSMPLQQPLTNFHPPLGEWRSDPPRALDQKTLEVLRVNDYVDVIYRNGKGDWISLYIGYFADQQSGQIIHSPKNCLPGSGWDFLESTSVTIEIPRANAPPIKMSVLRGILMNRDERLLSYYWYQSRGRFLASEYWDKFYLVLDAIQYNRTDGALVRVLAPLSKDTNIETVDAQLQDFIIKFTPILQNDYFPVPVGS